MLESPDTHRYLAFEVDQVSISLITLQLVARGFRLHQPGLAPQVRTIERQPTHQFRVVGAQRHQEERVYRPDVTALQDRAIPGAVAARTFVDQPRIKALAVGIDPDFSAASESPDTAAPVAIQPRLGGASRNNGP